MDVNQIFLRDKNNHNYNLLEKTTLIVITLIVFYLHFTTIKKIPAYFIDEGMYISRAWSFWTYHRVDIFPLDYDYDHPFLGWIIMGILAPIMPGEYWIEKVRLVMSIFASGQIILIFKIAKKYYSKYLALIPAIMYAFTIDIFFISHMVFIDNLATFFLLLTIYLFLNRFNSKKADSEEKKKIRRKNNKTEKIKREKIKREKIDIDKQARKEILNERNNYNKKYLIGSAIAFGSMVLIKYTYFLFIFGFWIFLYLDINIKKRNISRFKRTSNKIKLIYRLIRKESQIFWWSLVVLLVFSIWILYATIKGELWYNNGYSGLVSRIISQIFRKDSSPFWATNSYFSQSILYYYRTNPFLFILTPISIILIELMNYKIKKIKIELNNKLLKENQNLDKLLKGFQINRENIVMIYCFLIPYILFLIRGGVTYFFYFIPYFPIVILLFSGLIYQSSIFLRIIFEIRVITVSHKIKNTNNKKTIENNKLFSRKNIKDKVLVPAIISIIIILIVAPITIYPLFSKENAKISRLNTKTDIQYEALNWSLSHLPKDAVILSPAIFLPEMREAGFNRTHLLWRCSQYDPVFNSTILKGDWKNIDFFIADAETRTLLSVQPDAKLSIIQKAYYNSTIIKEFHSPGVEIYILQVNNGNYPLITQY